MAVSLIGDDAPLDEHGNPEELVSAIEDELGPADEDESDDDDYQGA